MPARDGVIWSATAIPGREPGRSRATGSGLREFAESRELAYVMAIGCNRHVTTVTGRTARADTIIAGLPKRKWHTLSAGDGAKGQRLYRWAFVALADAEGAAPGHRWLLARRDR
ncbi:hypothetical protein ACL02S_02085 [Nocardia sp. 004]|uniref:hypothetical protein n=1 Tax=Nocardia sp. 004 TaxID=3385978 RepID=UPI0039A16687